MTDDGENAEEASPMCEDEGEPIDRLLGADGSEDDDEEKDSDAAELDAKELA